MVENILVKLELGKSRIDVQPVKHIGLFVIVRSKHDVIDDVFQSLSGC